MLDFYINLSPQIKSSLLIITILSIAFILLNRKIKKVDPQEQLPLWIIPFVAAVDLINNYVKANIGKRWQAYAPYIMTLSIYLLVANTAGIWGLTPPTTYLTVTATLGAITFVLIQTTGIVSNGLLGYMKEFTKPTIFLAPLLVPINLIGELTFPVSLSLRLFGNILSGSVLNQFLSGNMGNWVVLVLPAFNLVFDIFFGVIQTIVFTLLTIIFISTKVNEEEKLLF